MAWSGDLEGRLAVMEGNLLGVSMVLGCLIDQLDPGQRKQLGAAVADALERIEANLLAQDDAAAEHNIQGLQYARNYFFGGEPPPDASPRSEPP